MIACRHLRFRFATPSPLDADASSAATVFAISPLFAADTAVATDLLCAVRKAARHGAAAFAYVLPGHAAIAATMPAAFDDAMQHCRCFDDFDTPPDDAAGAPCWHAQRVVANRHNAADAAMPTLFFFYARARLRHMRAGL